MAFDAHYGRAGFDQGVGDFLQLGFAFDGQGVVARQERQITGELQDTVGLDAGNPQRSQSKVALVCLGSLSRVFSSWTIIW